MKPRGRWNGAIKRLIMTLMFLSVTLVLVGGFGDNSESIPKCNKNAPSNGDARIAVTNYNEIKPCGV
ncbi:hypothetical protein [Paenibacillus sp. MMS18-CY102]|uniref:hypothetical protein n=1 Tax=Paenibacillus sp. MMS18-CY102 TaxID=2682849 RepID=UPI001365D952|nr:hypothetical protein [Paenibacillus sp. MMS18-CY102]MWC29542.1 hypothetical protein [Paenibacillus sp. MMS18-CY102]